MNNNLEQLNRDEDLNSSQSRIGDLAIQKSHSRSQILKTFAINIGVALVVFMAAFVAGNKFFFTIVKVTGTSMAPTLSDGELYVLNRLAYNIRNPKIGEVVVFKDPDDSRLSIKRIIGKPGDILEIRNGRVYRNDELISEPYLATNTLTFLMQTAGGKTFQLAEDEYFLLGDNRENSLDSRYYGSVEKSSILGVINKS